MKPLKRKHAKDFPPIAVYDIESTEWTNVQILCHVDEFGNRKSFKTVREYLVWLLTDFEGDSVWAHFGSGFDNRFLIEEVAKWDGSSYKAIMSGGLPIIFILENSNYQRPHPKHGKMRNRQVKLLDSYRLLPTSLANIGKSIGTPKMEVDRSRIEKLSDVEQIEYCFSDCDILLKGVQRFRDTIMKNGGNYSPTSASIASNFIRASEGIVWKKFFEPGSKYKRYSGESYSMGYPGSTPGMIQADEFSEAAYYGGRCEVFRRGVSGGPLYYYDIASAYPWAMTRKLPLYFQGFEPGAKWENREDVLRILKKFGIADALVYIPKGTYDYPPLPVRGPGEKVVFAEGRFHGRWTMVELMELYRTGADKGVTIDITCYAKFGAKAFAKPFVDLFYGLRKGAKESGDEAQSMIYKILLNSCYGKLAQQLEQSCYVYGPAYEFARQAAETDGLLLPTPLPGVSEIQESAPGPFRHVAAGAYVTALARLKLLRGMQSAEKIGANVYYCDTDSIIVDKPIPGWGASKELGAWELEAKLDSAEFLCPKVYRVTDAAGKQSLKAKGSNLKSQLELSEPQEVHAQESFLRWCVYAQHISSVGRRVTDRLSPEQQAYYGKAEAGLTGWKTGVNRGSIDCDVSELDRQARKPDSKRTHVGESSRPLFLVGDDGGDNEMYLDIRTMDPDSLVERELHGYYGESDE